MKSKELKVVYEDIDTGIEVKAMELIPEERIKEKYNRAKNKQELQKLAEEHGIEDAREINGSELKKILIEKFRL